MGEWERLLEVNLGEIKLKRTCRTLTVEINEVDPTPTQLGHILEVIHNFIINCSLSERFLVLFTLVLVILSYIERGSCILREI